MKKEDIIRLITIIGIMFCIWLFGGGYSKYASLSKNKEFIRGVITEFDFTSGKYSTKHYLRYTFLLNGTVYKGSGYYSPRKDTFSIGDTIVIVYDKTNPQNNRAYRDTY